MKKICDFIKSNIHNNKYQLTKETTDLNVSVNSWEYNIDNSRDKILLLYPDTSDTLDTIYKSIKIISQCTVKIQLKNVYNVLDVILIDNFNEYINFNILYKISKIIIEKLFEGHLIDNSNILYNEIIIVITFILYRIFIYKVYKFKNKKNDYYKNYSLFYIRHDLKKLFPREQLVTLLKEHYSKILLKLIKIIKSISFTIPAIFIKNITISFDEIIEYIFKFGWEYKYIDDIEKIDDKSALFDYDNIHKYIFIEIRNFNNQIKKHFNIENLTFADILKYSDNTLHDVSTTFSGVGETCEDTSKSESIDISTYIDKITKILCMRQRVPIRDHIKIINNNLTELFKLMNQELFIHIIDNIDFYDITEDHIKDSTLPISIRKMNIGDKINIFNTHIINDVVQELFKKKLVIHAIYLKMLENTKVIDKLHTDRIETYNNI
jgi:hypothetical protein